MNLQVGDYVRTKEGYICKILEIHEEYDDEYLDWNDIGSASIRKSHIIKSSPNIIDLIEVGDYVDKLRVVDKYENYIVVETFDERIVMHKEDTIKSIVTKEQFEQMEYKVGGNDD